MFVPFIAGLCIEKPTLCTGFRQVFIFDAAPTCFGIYVPPQGASLSLYVIRTKTIPEDGT
jgi:hypothetical protein